VIVSVAFAVDKGQHHAEQRKAGIADHSFLELRFEFTESTLLEANLKLAPGLPSIPKPTLRRPRSISVTSSTDSGRPLAGQSAQNRTPSARTGAPPPSPTSGSTSALDRARGRRPPPREETRRHEGGVTK